MHYTKNNQNIGYHLRAIASILLKTFNQYAYAIETLCQRLWRSFWKAYYLKREKKILKYVGGFMEKQMIKRAISDVKRELIAKNLQLDNWRINGASLNEMNEILCAIHKLKKEQQHYERLLSN